MTAKEEQLPTSLHPLTFPTLLLVFHRLEVDGGDGADQLHGLRFNQARALLVPASTLQVEASHPHTFLQGEGTGVEA